MCLSVYIFGQINLCQNLSSVFTFQDVCVSVCPVYYIFGQNNLCQKLSNLYFKMWVCLSVCPVICIYLDNMKSSSSGSWRHLRDINDITEMRMLVSLISLWSLLLPLTSSCTPPDLATRRITITSHISRGEGGCSFRKEEGFIERRIVEITKTQIHSNMLPQERSSKHSANIKILDRSKKYKLAGF